MKAIFLSSKSSHQDLLNYGGELFNKIISENGSVAYEQFEDDFSNVPELYDDDEKVVMFNHFAIPGGFNSLTKHLSKFKNIKYLFTYYSSYAGLDLELVKSLGIKFRNNGGANAKSVAQYAIACMLNLLSRFTELGRLTEAPDGSLMGEEFYTKTAGIIGMGNVGKEVLDILKKLGVNTVFYNRTPKDVSVTQVSIDEIFKQDIIFITIATNQGTKNLLSGISKLLQKKNYLVDVSSHDDLYDKQSIIDLLNQGELQGYALETESIFKSDKNLITTPHIAWCTVDAEKRTATNFLHRASLVLEGKAAEIDFII